MAKDVKTVTIRVSTEVADMFAGLGDGSINRGVVAAAAKLRTLTTRADNEIKGVFSEAECKFLGDSMVSTLIDESLRYSAGNLAYHNEDAQIYDGLADKHGIDVKELNDKVMRLTSAQMDAVYRRVKRLWDSEADMDAWARY